MSHSYQLDQSISNLRVVGWYYHSHSNSNRRFCKQTVEGDPDQTPHSVASDLGLHCLPMSYKKDARLILVSQIIRI